MNIYDGGFSTKLSPKLSEDQMPNDQTSWNDQKSVRWTVLFQKYYRNRNYIEMILGYA